MTEPVEVVRVAGYLMLTGLLAMMVVSVSLWSILIICEFWQITGCMQMRQSIWSLTMETIWWTFLILQFSVKIGFMNWQSSFFAGLFLPGRLSFGRL